MTTHRWIRTLHAWLGVTLGLLLVLASVTGTLLVWKDDYVAWRLGVTEQAFDPSPAALAAIGGAIERRFDGDDILEIRFATSDFPLTKVILADTRYAYVDGLGNVVDEWRRNERFEEWLYDLHHRLLLEDSGLAIVGCAALALLVVWLAGVVSFWPMRRGFRRGLWPKGTARPQLLASHRNLGIVLALPLLVTLVTAAVLAFPEGSTRLLLEPFRGEDYSLDFAEGLDDVSGGDSGGWLPTMHRALATFPGASIRTAHVPGTLSPYRIIGLRQPGELHPLGSTRVYFDAAEGWMDVRIDAQAQHVSERIYNLAYPLHTGRVGHWSYKWLWTACGASVAVLAVLGVVCFLRKQVAALGSPALPRPRPDERSERT